MLTTLLVVSLVVLSSLFITVILLPKNAFDPPLVATLTFWTIMSLEILLVNSVKDWYVESTKTTLPHGQEQHNATTGPQE